MALTKAGIIESIHDQLGLPKNKSTDIVESFLEIIKQSLENGEEVMISGFGKFCVNEKNARKGRNPQTGEHMIIEPRRVVTFRCSSRSRGKIDG